MNNRMIYLLLMLGLSTFFEVSAQNESAPYGLILNLLSQPQQVYVNGYPTSTPLKDAITQNENFQFSNISSLSPSFGWIVGSGKKSSTQTAYRLLLASDKKILEADSADVWDTGRVNSEQSLHILYNGNPLEPGNVYFWKVKTWDNHGHESPYSEVAGFKMADSLVSYATDRLPLQKKDDHPTRIVKVHENSYFADFGKAAFGRLRVTLYSESGNDTVTIHLGESVKKGRVDRLPGGSIRYSRYWLKLQQGWNTYSVIIRPDKRNTGPQAILMPRYIGEVTPFRYCEIENYNHLLQEKELVRETVFYPFNEHESYFHSSDTTLNQIWELCKYSIKATSFTGIYVDGDRERIPYEADALINQLSHYAVAREYNMPRYTHEYLIHHPTWPTEWILQSVLMAWEDYVYTGNKQSIEYYYEDLKAKTLIMLADEMGFISTRSGKVTPTLLESIHFKGNLRDIVDWPHTGIPGQEKEKGGETDGFIFTDINTVVNAYHYRALTLMARIAEALGKRDDLLFYNDRAARLKQSFNNHLFDKKRGVYVDGLGTEHASLHANMFPLAFGLVPKKHLKSVSKFIRSRGMACSVYGAQFLLDGIYNAHDADYGLQLLTATDERSWYNMIRSGSTITLEAWDNKYKPNQDWNHAWGTAAANLISRKLMGIEPIEPGFKKIRIKPQPGSLISAEIKQPTIRGEVAAIFHHDPGKSFHLKINIPANTSARVYLPFFSRNQILHMDGEVVSYQWEGNFSIIDHVGSGEHSFMVER